MLQPAFSGFRYDLAGEDVYRVKSAATVSRVSYTGSERLSARREGKTMRFEVRADYTRSSSDGKSKDAARFVTELLPDGSFVDDTDDDPDFLTILNQPFAIALDAATLRDLRQLHGRVPFSAASPLGGSAVLRGYLRPGASGSVGGRPTVGVRFEADGPMTGALPGHGAAAVSGNMRMDGTAFYALDDALLLALQVTLTLDATLRDRETGIAIPVKIVYRRSLRASGTPEGDLVKTPL